MNPRRWRALVVALAACPCVRVAAVTAQTHDEARLSMGISAGWIGAQHLWDVPNQPIYSTFEPVPDTFHISRSIRSNVTVSAHGTYFPHPTVGFIGEFTYLGIGSTDECSVVHDSGDAELLTACQALSGNDRTASTTIIQGGVVLRPTPRAAFQPYFEGAVGLAFTPSSTVETRSIYGAIGDTTLDLTIYTDNHWKQIRPTGTLAFGIATAPSQGYQLRLEIRETWLKLTEVTGATIGQGFEPGSDPSVGGSLRSVFKGFTSIVVGFDVVLARQRGRRY